MHFSKNTAVLSHNSVFIAIFADKILPFILK